jgi:ribosomal protein S25
MTEETPQKPAPYVPMTADQLTPELLQEALAQGRRYDRNFANKDGTEAIPVPARTCRLLGMAIVHLHNKLHGTAAQPAAEKGYFASTAAPKAPAAQKTAKAPAKKTGATKAQKKVPPRKAKTVAKKTQSGPPMTAEQSQAYETIKDILAAKQVVTTRLLADRGGWASHNTAARHIKNLLDLGYIKKVGKQQVIALTGLEP